ncbi:MAG: TolC family protein [Rhodothermaceae bacterium]|nr:TolC family protein [Rhodothermaceae bacterium]MXX58339.1 TolC family protein [Rhodothermaceae bacterium]MYD18801.1 TolC family protein [Rhodothermaceae bacterium]MYD56601.1 TolC family protein [Rhodothermaceae bacterium]MYI43815.1 TolC family protein [Rhodothermaceae bacterium]
MSTLMTIRLPLLVSSRMFCVGLLAFVTLAASAQVPQEITFQDAVRIALDQNIQLRQSANQLRLSEIDVRSARAAYLPSFNLSTGGGTNFGLSFDTNVGELRTTANSRFNMSARTSVTLFDGFQRQSNLRQSRLSVTANDLTLDRQRQWVVFEVASQFLAYIQQSEQIEVQQENLAAQQQQLAQIEEFVRVGTRPVSDLYQQQAAVESAELAILTTERQAQNVMYQLIQTLQLDPLGSYELVVPELQDEYLVPEEYDLGDLITRARQQRSDLRAQEIFVLAARQGLRAASGSMLPQLGFSAGAGTSYNSGIKAVDFGGQLERNRSESISLSVSVPVFNGLRTRTQKQRAQVSYENARLAVENTQQQVGNEVRAAYHDYLIAEKELEVSERQLVYRQQALDAARERYNVGAVTLVELTQAQSEWVQASQDAITARYTIFVRKRLISYFTGELDPNQPLFD